MLSGYIRAISAGVRRTGIMFIASVLTNLKIFPPLTFLGGGAETFVPPNRSSSRPASGAHKNRDTTAVSEPVLSSASYRAGIL